MSVNIGVGRRLPAFATSTGRLLLSSLTLEQLDDFFESYPRPALTNKTITDEATLRELIATAGEQGWTINDEEFEHGVRAVAAPVYDVAGVMWAAVNISLPASGRQ